MQTCENYVFHTELLQYGWKINIFPCLHSILFVNSSPECIQPFWISRLSCLNFIWQSIGGGGDYCACMNRHSPIGWLIQQWDASAWVIVIWPSYLLWQYACSLFIFWVRFLIEYPLTKVSKNKIVAERIFQPLDATNENVISLLMAIHKNCIQTPFEK